MPSKWLPPVNCQTVIPAARPARIPASESSISRQRSGATPALRAARSGRSGAGLPWVTSAAVVMRPSK